MPIRQLSDKIDNDIQLLIQVANKRYNEQIDKETHQLEASYSCPPVC